MAMAQNGTGASFTAKQLNRLVRWSGIVLFTLLVTIFGTVGLALKKAGSGEDPEKCAAVEECEETSSTSGECGCSADGERRPHRPPPPPPLQPAGLTLDLDVNVGTPPADSGERAGGGQGAATQTVTINGVSVPAGPSAAADGRDASGEGGSTQTVSIEGVPMSAQVSSGNGGTDLVLVLDRENEVVKPSEPRKRWRKKHTREEPPSFCKAPTVPPDESNPCARAELLGRVEFEHGSRKFDPEHPDPFAGILEELGSKTGALLVIGHGDSCGETRLAERRAARTRRELRRLLRNRLEFQNGNLSLHSQAAGKDGGAPESKCRPAFYGTAGVYLVKGAR